MSENRSPLENASDEAKPGLSQTVGLGLILLAAFLNRALLFGTPTLRDEGIFGYVAQEWLRGNLPFSTVVDNKGVLLYLEFVLGLAIYQPDSLAGVRFLASIFVALSVLVLYVLTRRMWNPKVALIAAGLFAFHISLQGFDAHQCGSEVFGTLPMLASISLVWIGWENRKNSSFLWAGVLLGLAAWTRLTFVAMSLFFVLFLAWAEKGQRRLTSPLLGICGFFLACLPFFLLYGWSGQLDLLYEAYITFTQVWAEGGSHVANTAGDFKRLSLALVKYGFILILACFLGPPTLSRTEPRTIFMWLWLGCALFSLLAPKQYLLKQLIQIFPPLCILAAHLIDLATRKESGAVRRAVTLGLVSLSLISGLYNEAPAYVSALKGDLKHNQLFHKSEKIAKWVQDNSQDSDTLYCWGLEWQVYFNSERRSPTRHMNLLYTVMLGIAVESGLPLQEPLTETQDEIMKDLKAKSPRVVIVTAKVDNYNLTHYTLPQRFQSFLDANYDFVFHDEPFYVFLRKPEQATESEQSS